MSLFLLQADLTNFNWGQFGMATGAIVVLVSILVFILKIVPGIASTWKEIKLAEISVREEETKTRSKEAESRTQQANGFSQLAGALSQMSNVLHDVVIEQRHATEKVMILQRVNTDTSEQVMASVNDLTDEIASIRAEMGTQRKNGTQAKATPTS
jgi:C4-dicarboxylate-specific signal transduction histidine kinase